MRLLQVFNRYLHAGGEEKSVERIYLHLQQRHEVSRCLFDSHEWKKPGAPSKISQVARLFYNPSSRQRLIQAITTQQSQALLVHNIYPVASSAVFHVAMQRHLPVIHYLHNFRPFSVSGTLYSKGRILSEALSGNWQREVREGTWQSSIVKSALFAGMLKWLHWSRWLNSVKAWVAISDFMRRRLIEAGVSAMHIHTLRHSWDAMQKPINTTDGSYYLFLGRLVEEKGVLVLLEAWAKLRVVLGKRTPELRLAGEGPLETVVKQHATDNPSVTYLGFMNGAAKTKALSECRALVVPSTWWEPLGIVVYEAYDHARPVLAARSGGLTETVLDQITGFLHEPGSVDALIHSVLQLESCSADQRRSMGAMGRDWLLRETTVERWQKGFDEILATI
jgi:glycosyltransferase involved in cell wall biosynthesis